MWRDIDDTDYYNCPIRFIPDSILEWHAEYSYYKTFESAPGAYHEVSAKWLEAMQVYRGYLTRYSDEVSRSSKRDTTAPLKFAVRGRKHGH